MNHSGKIMTLLFLAALAGCAGPPATRQPLQAQEQDFPQARTQLRQCTDIDWNRTMLDEHPRLIDACREVVVVDGEKWARFEAKFVRVEPDGTVQFRVRDRQNRSVEEFLLRPAAGQVAYLDDEAVPFAKLRSSDAISLYMPENRYGFVTAPGKTLLATIVPENTMMAAAPAAAPKASERQTPRATQLPRTASALPWLAFSGAASLLVGLGLSLRRRRA